MKGEAKLKHDYFYLYSNSKYLIYKHLAKLIELKPTEKLSILDANVKISKKQVAFLGILLMSVVQSLDLSRKR